MDFAIKLIAGLAASVLCAGAAHGYTLNVHSGVLPNGVETANLNALTPDANGYKRGWTKDGWTVDRFGDRGYILVSPTYTGENEACANALTLPAIEVSEGDYLSWEIRSAMPEIGESYCVTIRKEGDAAEDASVLWQEEATPGRWTPRVVSLSQFVGMQVVVEFRAVSVNKYLLCLDKVEIGPLTDYKMVARRTSPVFFDSKDMASNSVKATFDITNTGRKVVDGVFECRINGEAVSSVPVAKTLNTGDTRTVEFALPSEADVRKGYSIIFMPTGGDEVSLYDGEYFCTTYRPHLLVDKGTGTWCNNCPESSLTVDQLKDRFGDGLIMLESHNADIMANETYFEQLKYRAIPYWMLNRISATRFSKPTYFDEYIFRPCQWDIALTAVENDNDTRLQVSAKVRTASDVDNTDDRYRIGYVVTSDFHNPDNAMYSQRNNASIPGTEQFYYLPSSIPAALMTYHNVTLTSDNAFTGIDNSLPGTMEAGKIATFSFDVERPALLDNLNDARMVVYVLDTETGEVLNSFAGKVGEDFSLSIDTPLVDADAGKTYPGGIWNLQGIRVSDSINDLPHGIYIVDGKKIKI